MTLVGSTIKVAWGRATYDDPGGSKPVSWVSKCGKYRIVRTESARSAEDAVYAFYPPDAGGKGYPTRSLRDAKMFADFHANGSKPEDTLRMFAKPCRHNPKGGLGRTIPMNPTVPDLTEIA
jgi:hypothetical protein